jgi:histone H3/H4
LSLIEVHALNEIKHYQKQQGIIIPRSAFSRLFREILHNQTYTVTHVSAEAFACTHLAAEEMLTTWFELVYNTLLCFAHDIVIERLSMQNAKQSWIKTVISFVTLSVLSILAHHWAARSRKWLHRSNPSVNLPVNPPDKPPISPPVNS